jgi:hypothetical protein
VKVADTLWFAVIDTLQVPVPLHPAPLQPAKLKPLAGVAVSVTCVPLLKLAAQVAPQLIPEGELVTVPLLLPILETAREKVIGKKVAETLVFALTVTVQVLVPLHPPPLQPVNRQPAAGVAVKVTCVPVPKLALQVAPQLIPDGELVTVPLPDTDVDRANVFPTVTSTAAEAIPLATTTSELGPVSMVAGTMKLVVDAVVGAIECVLDPKVVA